MHVTRAGEASVKCFSMVTPEPRRKFIKDVAREFSRTDFVEERDGDLIGLAWEQDGLSAGAAVNEESVGLAR